MRVKFKVLSIEFYIIKGKIFVIVKYILFYSEKKKSLVSRLGEMVLRGSSLVLMLVGWEVFEW